MSKLINLVCKKPHIFHQLSHLNLCSRSTTQIPLSVSIYHQCKNEFKSSRTTQKILLYTDGTKFSNVSSSNFLRFHSAGTTDVLSARSFGSNGKFRGLQSIGATGVRWNSSSASDIGNLPPGYIPEPPLPVGPTLSESVTDIVQQLNALGEPTLQSLGLASWWPNGIVQWALEALHVSMDLPWWGAIALMTLGLRIAMFPLVILAQRNSANMHNHMPLVQAYQQKFQKARMSGNPLEAARAGSEYMEYMKKNNVNPVKSMMFPLTQVPVFLSVFIGVRQMANLPVESMTTGGILWFTDLTIADPFYALPILTCATFFATMELGVDGVKAATLSTTARTVMRAMPIIMFPLILNFPTAMLCYWMTSNIISLFQVGLLRIEAVKDFCKIPKLVTHDPALLKNQKQPFLKSIKENYKTGKTMVSMDERLRDEAIKFKQAGLGAVQKTYDYDPTKVRHKDSTTAVEKSSRKSSANS